MCTSTSCFGFVPLGGRENKVKEPWTEIIGVSYDDPKEVKQCPGPRGRMLLGPW